MTGFEQDGTASSSERVVPIGVLSKTELVYARLREDIVAGRYQPGMPISERAVPRNTPLFPR